MGRWTKSSFGVSVCCSHYHSAPAFSPPCSRSHCKSIADNDGNVDMRLPVVLGRAAHTPSRRDGKQITSRAPMDTPAPTWLSTDAAFLARDQALDVAAVAPEQQQAHHPAHDQHWLRRLLEPEKERCEQRRDERRERGDAKYLRHQQPRRLCGEGHWPRNAKQHAERGGDALAAVKAEKQQKKKTKKSNKPDNNKDVVVY